jgi:hypothetical protein
MAFKLNLISSSSLKIETLSAFKAMSLNHSIPLLLLIVTFPNYTFKMPMAKKGMKSERIFSSLARYNFIFQATTFLSLALSLLLGCY